MKKARTAQLSLRKLFIAMLAAAPVAILPSPLLAAVPTTTPFTQQNGTGATYSGSGTLATIGVPNNAILVWGLGNFTIASTDTFNFNISTPGGAVLNKVGYSAGADNATINGTLAANGKVFILANGNIILGSGSRVSTQGGLYLSTLNENPDFFSGSLNFVGTSTGSITIGGGGTVADIIGGLNAYAGSITLNSARVTGDTILSQRGALGTLNLAATGTTTTLTGNLIANTTQSAITGPGALQVLGAGTAVLSTNGNTTGAAVTLPNADFNSLVLNVGSTTAAGAVTIADPTGIILGNATTSSTIVGDVSITSGGAISTEGTLNIAGNATFTGAGNISITNNSTITGASGLSATTSNGAVTIATVGNLTTGTISGGGVGAQNITISTNGTLTVNGAITSPAGSNVNITAPSIAATATGSVGPVGLSGVTLNATAGTLVAPTLSANSIALITSGGAITQFGTTIITLGGGSLNANAVTGNVALTNANDFNSGTLHLTGANASVTSIDNFTVGSATIPGTLTLSTVGATFGGGDITLGSGGGTSAGVINIGGNLTVTTNGGDVVADNSSTQTIAGAVNINTFGAGAGGVFFIPITGGGIGYTAAPSVTFTGGGGSGAAASTVITNGTVTGIRITNVGTGYTAAPTIGFSASGSTTAATAAATLSGSGNVTFLGAQTAEGGVVTRYGQFNVSGNVVQLSESTGLNLGNITANRVSANSTGGDVFITGNVSTSWFGGNNALGNSSFGARSVNNGIIESGAGVLTVAGTSRFEVNNSASTNLTSSSSNAFGGTVLFVNGAADIVNTSSNITFTPGNVTSGSLTVNQVGSSLNTVTLTGGNATDVRINSTGPVVLDNALVRNLTINTTTTAANAITQTANLTANGTVTLTSAGNTTLTHLSNNITGTVVLSNVTAAETTIYSSRNLTVSGTSSGNLTAIAGAGSGNSFSSPWNLILGNLSVNNLNGAALNAATVITNSVSSLSVPITGLGSGYTSAPTVTFTGGGGTGAAATAIIAGGTIAGFTITNAGTGYTSAPTISYSTVAGATAPTTAPTVGLAAQLGNGNGGNAAEGNSGNITQSNNARLNVQNTLNLATFNGNIVVANNGNSASRVQFATGGAPGLSGTGNITYVEDSFVKIGNIHTNGNATITSRFGSIFEDPLADVVINVGGLLTLNAPNGSVLLGNTTHTVGTTTGVIANITVNTTGAAALTSTGNISLAPMSANSLIVTSTAGNITQSGPLNIFGTAAFNAATGITLNDSANNFGPVSLNITGVNQNVSITEANTLNLRGVTFPAAAGNGTFTATSVNGDIMDSGFTGVVIGGRLANATATPAQPLAMGTGTVTLNAVNGNIVIDDLNTDFPTFGGVAFNARNVTLSVLGGADHLLYLGTSNTTSVVTGNLSVTSTLGSIAQTLNGNISVSGDASFIAGNGNITVNQNGNRFGTVRFNGRDVDIKQVNDMNIARGSTATGNATLESIASYVTLTPGTGTVTLLGNSTIKAGTSITLQKGLQVFGNLTVNAPEMKDLSALSISADLAGRTPTVQGGPAYLPPAP